MPFCKCTKPNGPLLGFKVNEPTLFLWALQSSCTGGILECFEPWSQSGVHRAAHWTNSNFTNIWNQGVRTSAPLPLSIGFLAGLEWGECHQNKLYKPWNGTFWGLSLLQLKPSPVKVRFQSPERSTRTPASEAILYLHSQRRALLFPSWGKWRGNFSTPSNEGSLKFALLRFFFLFLLKVCLGSHTRREKKRGAASFATSDKHQLSLFPQTNMELHLISLIFLFQLVNSCASYYPSSCDYSPPSLPPGLTEEEGKARGTRSSLGFGVFTASAGATFRMWGGKVELQSMWSNGASNVEGGGGLY